MRNFIILGHAQYYQGRVKTNDHEIETAQTPKPLEGRLALLEKIRKTFIDSIGFQRREPLNTTESVPNVLAFLFSNCSRFFVPHSYFMCFFQRMSA